MRKKRLPEEHASLSDRALRLSGKALSLHQFLRTSKDMLDPREARGTVQWPSPWHLPDVNENFMNFVMIHTQIGASTA